MPREMIQIGSAYRAIEREADGYRVPLGRRYAETPRQAHEKGLWQVLASPTHGSLGRDRKIAGILLAFPALAEDDDSCLVSAAVGEYLEEGQILWKAQVVE